jgi:predicted membrane protein
MGFLFTGVFWGIVIILVGVSIVLREVFGVNIPIIRVVFGLILIYIGARVLLGPIWKDRNRDSGPPSSLPYEAEKGEYNIIFSSNDIDLSNYRPEDGRKKIEVNVVFGSGRLILPNGVPVHMDVSNVFGRVDNPSRATDRMGERSWDSPDFDPAKPHLSIEANVVFGRLHVMRGGGSDF